MTHEHLRNSQSQSTADELFVEAIASTYYRGRQRRIRQRVYSCTELP